MTLMPILTAVNGLLVVANVGLLQAIIKIYTEILKIEHIKRIGKDPR